MRLTSMLILLLVCSGCLSMSARNDYTVDLSAQAGVSVRDFVVEYPGFKGYIPDFGVSAGMVYMSVEAPLPEAASCSWRTKDGGLRTLSVPITSLLPEEFDASRDKLIFSVLSNESMALSVALREKRFHERVIPLSSFTARSQGGDDKVSLGIDIGVVNNGNERIENATVAFGDYNFSVGTVSPGKKKVHVCSEQSVPDTAKISLLFADGKEVVRTVAVRPHLPKESPKDLVVHFKVNEQRQVLVEFLHFVEVDGRHELVPLADSASSK